MTEISLNSRRAVLVGASALVSLALLRANAAPPPVRVLFICEFGTAKSAVARELFRRRVRERGIAATAFSRGLDLADHVSPQLKARLATAGINPAADAPVKLSKADFRRADIVVAFAKVPGREVRDWSSLAALNDSYDVAMPDLQARIERLIDGIAAREGSRR